MTDNPQIFTLAQVEFTGILRQQACSAVREKVRYADVSAWTISHAVQELMQTQQIDWSSVSKKVSIILIGDTAPVNATDSVKQMMLRGQVSPMRFAAANSGAAISVCCTAFSFSGPTLNLTLPEKVGTTIAQHIATRWLSTNKANYVFLISHARNLKNEVTAKARLMTLKRLCDE